MKTRHLQYYRRNPHANSLRILISFIMGWSMCCIFLVRPIEKERQELNELKQLYSTFVYQARVLYESVETRYRVLQEIEKGNQTETHK